MTGFMVAAVIGLALAVACIRPRSVMQWLMAAGCSLPLGIGVTSAAFFAVRAIWPASPALVFSADAILALLAIAAAATVWRSSAADAAEPSSALRPHDIVVGTFACLALIVTLDAANSAVRALPHGDWDAWSIWNLRAMYLASEAPRVAWSSALSETHPEYPLLLPASVARLWLYRGGPESTDAPAMLQILLIGFAAVAGAGAIGIARGPTVGFLSISILIGCPSLIFALPVQYADVPLGIFVFLAVALLMADQPLLAGAFASFAMWTKDEGLVFVLAFLVLGAIWRSALWPRLMLGAIPVGAVALVFRLMLAERAGGAPLPYRWIWQTERISLILEGLRSSFLGLGYNWYHPILPVAALLVLLGATRARSRDSLFTGLLAVAMYVGYFLAFMTTTDDLRWRISSSVGRLGLQVWPLIGLAMLLGSRSPESLTARVKLRELPETKPKRKPRPVRFR